MAGKTGTVAQTHPLYDKFRFAWRTVRDCIEGESAVKRADTVYLPMPSAMVDQSQAASESFISGFRSMSMMEDPDEIQDYWREYDPSFHSNPAYAAYKKRAHFPLITSSIFRGMKGIVTARSPVMDIPSAIDYIKTDMSRDGKGLLEFYDAVLDQNLQVGRLAVVIDIDDKTDTLYGSIYKAESLVNWKEEVVDGKRIVKFLVFREWVDDEEANEFDNAKIARYRVLRLREGRYEVDIYNESTFGYTVVPMYRGKTLGYIPAVIIGSTCLDLHPDETPMHGVARCAIQIYIKDADQSQAEFLTCNPTLFVSGVDKEDTPDRLGSGVVVGLPNPDSKAWYPRTDTSALVLVKDHKEDLYAEAFEYGLSLLGGKKVAESAEALQLRQAASGASLVTIVDTSGKGVLRALQIICDWVGLDPAKAVFAPNTTFANTVLTAAQMQALLQAWIGGGISQDTYMDKLREAGTIAADVSNEEERKRIEANPPPILPTATTGPGNDSQITHTLPTDNPKKKVREKKAKNGGAPVTA